MLSEWQPVLLWRCFDVGDGDTARDDDLPRRGKADFDAVDATFLRSLEAAAPSTILCPRNSCEGGESLRSEGRLTGDTARDDDLPRRGTSNFDASDATFLCSLEAAAPSTMFCLRNSCEGGELLRSEGRLTARKSGDFDRSFQRHNILKSDSVNYCAFEGKRLPRKRHLHTMS